MTTLPSDLPNEIIDIIFSFVPSTGLHVSRKYNDVCLCSSAYTDLKDFLLHEHRKETDFCKHIWEHNYESLESCEPYDPCDPQTAWRRWHPYTLHDDIKKKVTVQSITYNVLHDRNYPEIVYKWFLDAPKKNTSHKRILDVIRSIIKYLKKIPRDSKELVDRLKCFYNNHDLYWAFMSTNFSELTDNPNMTYFADIIKDEIVEMSLDFLETTIVQRYFILRATINSSCLDDKAIANLTKKMIK